MKLKTYIVNDIELTDCKFFTIRVLYKSHVYESVLIL